MEKIEIKRKDLYNLVWSKPMAALIQKYKIKNSELRKILSEMNIPIPEMGYWQKIQYCKPVEIKELPINFSGRKEVTFISHGSLTFYLTSK